MQKAVIFLFMLALLIPLQPIGAQGDATYTCDGGEHDIVAAIQAAFDARDFTTAQELITQAQTLCISNVLQYRAVLELQSNIQLEIQAAQIEEFLNTSDPGLVNLGDYSLFMRCVGEGSPTVIFENGLGLNSFPLWDKVVLGLEDVTRVCVYDRLGVGYSDNAPKRLLRTTQDQVDDLLNLLDTADIEGPFVLVGHDTASYNMLLFTDQHPDMVVGIVMVDASHPREWEMLAAIEGHTITIPKLGEPISTEHMDMLASAEQVLSLPHDLGDLPLVVLTAGAEADESTAFEPALGSIWLELQQDHASLSTNSQHIVVEGAYHFFMETHPEIIIEAVEWVLAQVEANTAETE
jgi:pimeloyl-ACP methyl ester carboxylesterase